MDPNRSAGEPTMHLCHYPNCGKVYKVINVLMDFATNYCLIFLENLAFKSSSEVAYRRSTLSLFLAR